jgi:hypothetical protein
MRIFVYHKPSPHTMGDRIREALIEKIGGEPPLEGPVNLRMRFIFYRDPAKPRSVPQVEEPPTFSLVRAVMNQLPGILYREERQVVSIVAAREYGNINAIEVKC